MSLVMQALARIELKMKNRDSVEIAAGLFKFQSEEKWQALERECEARGWKLERKNQLDGFPGTGLAAITRKAQSNADERPTESPDVAGPAD